MPHLRGKSVQAYVGVEHRNTETAACKTFKSAPVLVSFPPLFLSLLPDLPLTLVPCGVVSAVDAAAGPLVALLGVSVALAGLAVGEAPVASLAGITARAEGVGAALALPRVLLTETASGALRAALARWAERQWGAASENGLNEHTESYRNTCMGRTSVRGNELRISIFFKFHVCGHSKW